MTARAAARQPAPSRASSSQTTWIATSASQPVAARAVQYQIAVLLTRCLGGRNTVDISVFAGYR